MRAVRLSELFFISIAVYVSDPVGQFKSFLKESCQVGLPNFNLGSPGEKVAVTAGILVEVAVNAVVEVVVGFIVGVVSRVAVEVFFVEDADCGVGEGV